MPRAEGDPTAIEHVAVPEALPPGPPTVGRELTAAPRREPPVYRVSTTTEPRARRRVTDVADSVFIVIGLVSAAWLAMLLLWSSFRLSPSAVLPLIGFYALVSYLLLPRMHQVFTDLYVPNYFIGRTRTSDGLLGDPVNLAVDGSEHDIHAAMQRAGWTLADEVTIASGLKIVASTLLRRTYKEAPVSDLMLFGRRQDFAYQQEVGGDASKRHHVRFWKAPDGWLLPGGQKVGWLAAGTYDRAVGLSMFTWQVTHKIDPDTDAERDYIVATVEHADPDVGLRVIEGFSTAYHARNGGGDEIRTDGNLPILNVAGAARRSGAEVARIDTETTPGTGFTRHHIPPVGLLFAGLLCILRAVQLSLLIPQAMRMVVDVSPEAEWLVAFLLGAMAVAYVVLWLLTLRRRRWSRMLFMLLLALDSVIALGGTLQLRVPGLLTVAGVALSVTTLLAVSGSAARAWVNEGPTK